MKDPDGQKTKGSYGYGSGSTTLHIRAMKSQGFRCKRENRTTSQKYPEKVRQGSQKILGAIFTRISILECECDVKATSCDIRLSRLFQYYPCVNPPLIRLFEQLRQCLFTCSAGLDRRKRVLTGSNVLSHCTTQVQWVPYARHRRYSIPLQCCGATVPNRYRTVGTVRTLGTVRNTYSSSVLRSHCTTYCSVGIMGTIPQVPYIFLVSVADLTTQLSGIHFCTITPEEGTIDILNEISAKQKKSAIESIRLVGPVKAFLLKNYQ